MIIIVSTPVRLAASYALAFALGAIATGSIRLKRQAINRANNPMSGKG